MALHDLLKAFEGEETLPIDLNKISKWIIAQGAQDEIEFIGVDLDVNIIRGYLYRFRYSKVVYGSPVCAAQIYYGRGQEAEWINIVVAKELIHCMDGNNAVRNKDELDNLFKRLALPMELKHILEDPGYAQIDRLGDAFAAALLLPKAAREILLPAFKAKDITATDIAQLAVIPVRYARLVMDDRWDSTYERMMLL